MLNVFFENNVVCFRKKRYQNNRKESTKFERIENRKINKNNNNYICFFNQFVLNNIIDWLNINLSDFLDLDDFDDIVVKNIEIFQIINKFSNVFYYIIIFSFNEILFFVSTIFNNFIFLSILYFVSFFLFLNWFAKMFVTTLISKTKYKILYIIEFFKIIKIRMLYLFVFSIREKSVLFPIKFVV